MTCLVYYASTQMNLVPPWSLAPHGPLRKHQGKLVGGRQLEEVGQWIRVVRNWPHFQHQAFENKHVGNFVSKASNVN